MTLRRYEKYKTINLPHLTEIPSHWEFLPNKALFSQVHRAVGDDWVRTQLLSLSLKGIVRRDIDSGEGKYPSDFGTYQLVETNDLVFCLFDMDETPRTVGLSGLRGMITGAYDVVRCRPGVVPAYVHYYYLYVDSFKGLRPFYTGLRKVVRPPTFMAVQMPVPSVEEQAAIAEFLDQETSKIDALIIEQQRLIELLKEKRQAVISHAVTKGLNPHVRMKPSGVEWLGEVPEHWEIVPLRRLISANRRITYGIVQPGEPDENGRYMVRGQDYSFGWARADSIFKVSDSVEAPYKRSRLMPGDLVMTIVGAGVGNLAVVPEWLDGANITQTTARLAIDPTQADSRFVRAVLDGPIGKRSVGYFAKGAAQPGLNLEHVKLFTVTVPPLTEQREIADYIEGLIRGLESLEAAARAAILLLQERRTALISAAVTGKIDVRNYASTQKDAA
jgi:type I restriction enzyme S subunit